jgi:hypothetical protein
LKNINITTNNAHIRGTPPLEEEFRHLDPYKQGRYPGEKRKAG